MTSRKPERHEARMTAVPPTDLEGLLRRDLEAWLLAKAAIEKARRPG
jgi:hypothetical protein